MFLCLKHPKRDDNISKNRADRFILSFVTCFGLNRIEINFFFYYFLQYKNSQRAPNFSINKKLWQKTFLFFLVMSDKRESLLVKRCFTFKMIYLLLETCWKRKNFSNWPKKPPITSVQDARSSSANLQVARI